MGQPAPALGFELVPEVAYEATVEIERQRIAGAMALLDCARQEVEHAFGRRNLLSITVDGKLLCACAVRHEQALRTIARDGLAVYSQRVTRPYLTAARRHFDRRNLSHTERLLRRLQRTGPPEGDSRAE